MLTRWIDKNITFHKRTYSRFQILLSANNWYCFSGRMGNSVLLLGPHNRPLEQRRPTLRKERARLQGLLTSWFPNRPNLDRLDHAHRTHAHGRHISRKTATRKLWAVLVYASPVRCVFYFLVDAWYLVYDSGGFCTLLFGDGCFLWVLDLRGCDLSGGASGEGDSWTTCDGYFEGDSASE